MQGTVKCSSMAHTALLQRPRTQAGHYSRGSGRVATTVNPLGRTRHSLTPRRLRVHCSGPVGETEKAIPPPISNDVEVILRDTVKESAKFDSHFEWKKSMWEKEKSEGGYWSLVDKDSLAYSGRVGLSLLLLSPLAWDGWLQELVTHGHGWWPMLTALICSEKTLGNTVNKGMRRALGTIVGCGSVCLVVPLAQPWLDMGMDPRALFSLAVLGFTSYVFYYRKYNQSWDYAFFVTVLSFNLTLLDSYQEGWSLEAPFFRILMTGLGASTALAMTSIVAPRSSEHQLLSALSTATSEAASFAGKMEELCSSKHSISNIDLEMDKRQYRQGLDMACKAHLHSVVNYSVDETKKLDIWRHELGYKDAVAHFGINVDTLSETILEAVLRWRKPSEQVMTTETAAMSEGWVADADLLSSRSRLRRKRIHLGLPKNSMHGNSNGAHLRTLASVLESMRVQCACLHTASDEAADMLHNCQAALRCIAEHVKYVEAVPESLQEWHLNRLSLSYGRVQKALQSVHTREVTCKISYDSVDGNIVAEAEVAGSQGRCSFQEQNEIQHRMSLLCLALQLPSLVEKCFVSTRSLVTIAG